MDSYHITATILGCGSSGGVPLIGCECAVCLSDNPKNKRTRVSLLLEVFTTSESTPTKLLIDTSPDLRMQALRHTIREIDAILYTHAHADHMHGIDDVRAFNYARNAPTPIYGTHKTLEEIQRFVPYAFLPPKPEYGWFRPALTPITIEAFKDIQIDKVVIQPFLQHHGKHLDTLGFRIGNVAYSTDVNDFPEESYPYLENLDVWIVDCLSPHPAPTHAHLDLTLTWIERFQPKHAVLTHMGHLLEYEALRSQLPAHIEPAYDGWQMSL